MKVLRLVAVSLVVVILAGCTGTHTVDWYKSHNPERIAKLKQCQADPGELQYTPNCVNATQAAADLMLSPKNGKVPSL